MLDLFYTDGRFSGTNDRPGEGHTSQFEFRFEALNALNHPVWDFSGGPANGSFDPGTWTLGPTGVPQTTNATFGKITGSQGARELQLALKFYF